MHVSNRSQRLAGFYSHLPEASNYCVPDRCSIKQQSVRHNAVDRYNSGTYILAVIELTKHLVSVGKQFRHDATLAYNI